LDNTAAAEMGWDDSEEEWTFSDSVDVEEDLTVGGTTQLEAWGDSPFTALDGLLLLGPGCPLTETAWTSLRGQTATISGAFHTVNGRWPGTRALMVEEATTNIIGNPVINDITGYSAYSAGTTISASTDWFLWGDKSIKAVCDGTNNNQGAAYSMSGLLAATTTYTFSVWTKGSGIVNIRWRDYTNGDTVDGAGIALSEKPQRISLTFTTGALVPAVAQLIVKTSGAQAVTFYADGWQAEEGDVFTSLCYGDLAWCDWTGAAHASTSTRAATEVNLDAYASLLASNNAYSILMWYQPVNDADDNASAVTLFDVSDGTSNNRLRILYSADFGFRVYINGGYRLVSGVQTHSAGDWIHVAVTCDFAADVYALYINNELVDTDATVLAPLVGVDEMNLGTNYVGAQQINGAISEAPIFNSVLTAAEVAAIYQSGVPLIDQGATDTPVVAGDMVQLQISTANVSNPPTDAELTEAFGTPRNGFMALVDDADAGTTVWKVWRAADAWWYEELTEAV